MRDQNGVSTTRPVAVNTSLLRSGSCATYSVQDILELQLVPAKMSRPRWMMRNTVYLVSPDDVDEEEIDPMDLAPLESSSAPIGTVPAEAEEAVEDAAEDESISSLESDYSTEEEDRDGVAGPSGTMNLVHLEDGDMQLVVNGSSMEEDDLQPPDDIGGNDDVVHPFASNAGMADDESLM